MGVDYGVSAKKTAGRDARFASGAEPAKAGSWPAIASLSAIASTVFAAQCALGLLLTLLGLGGTGLILNVAPLRPYLTAATVVFLAAGLYLTHVKRCANGPNCGIGRAKRGASLGAKVLFWIAAAVAAFFLAVPHLI